MDTWRVVEARLQHEGLKDILPVIWVMSQPPRFYQPLYDDLGFVVHCSKCRTAVYRSARCCGPSYCITCAISSLRFDEARERTRTDDRYRHMLGQRSPEQVKLTCKHCGYKDILVDYKCRACVAAAKNENVAIGWPHLPPPPCYEL